MAPQRKRGLKIQNIILQSSIIDELQLRSALGRMDQWGTRLPRTLCDMEMVSEDQIMEVIGEGLQMAVTPLGSVPRDSQALSKLTKDYCVEWGVFPVSLRNRVLTVAMADPTELDLVDEMQTITQCRIQVLLSGENDIQNAIKREYLRQAPTREVPAQRNAAVEVQGKAGEAVFELDTGDEEPKRAAPKPSQQRPATRAPPPPAMSAPPQPAPVPPPAQSVPPPAPAPVKDVTNIAAVLDSIMTSDVATFSIEDLTRLNNIQMTQHKTTLIFKALSELLKEKGILP